MRLSNLRISAEIVFFRVIGHTRMIIQAVGPSGQTMHHWQFAHLLYGLLGRHLNGCVSDRAADNNDSGYYAQRLPRYLTDYHHQQDNYSCEGGRGEILRNNKQADDAGDAEYPPEGIHRAAVVLVADDA